MRYFSTHGEIWALREDGMEKCLRMVDEELRVGYKHYFDWHLPEDHDEVPITNVVGEEITEEEAFVELL